MSIAETVHELHNLRTHFGRRNRKRKHRLLGLAAGLHLDDAKTLREYHDTLMFMAAYPDDAEILRLINAEQRRIGRIARRIMAGDSKRARNRLSNSGIAGTNLTCSFSLDMATWLTRRFGRAVELDWEDDSAGSALDEYLSVLVANVERDGLLSERFTTREWFGLAKGNRRRTDLAWLVEQFEHLDGSPQVREHAFDSLNLHLHWKLTDKNGSRTGVRFASRPIFYEAEGLHRRASLHEWMGLPLPTTKRLSVARARQLLDACRATLCVRHREIDTLTYANDRDVALLNLERGIDVAVFGMQPARRLPIESYFGFVVARNRVPIGYGGGWVFFDRSEIGVNVFDEFRGGESAFVFAQVIRVYHQYLGARRFVVDPYQFGAGNTEAIRSGAFWFYYRLGFRPADDRSRQLADAEFERILADRSYRSPTRVLRKLARARLVFDLDTDAPAPGRDLEPSDIGIAVTRWIGKRFDGDRRFAGRWAPRRVMRDLGVDQMSGWPAAEREAFERMSVLLGPIAGLRSWSNGEKQSLVSIMRSKGGSSERSYIQKLRRHTKLHDALQTLSRRR